MGRAILSVLGIILAAFFAYQMIGPIISIAMFLLYVAVIAAVVVIFVTIIAKLSSRD